jgi:hypothetical protein
VDGTNCRLVFGPNGSALVGSREDLLWERRDLIGNPAMGIVEAVRDAVQRLYERVCRPDRVAVYYVDQRRRRQRPFPSLLEVDARHIREGHQEPLDGRPCPQMPQQYDSNATRELPPNCPQILEATRWGQKHQKPQVLDLRLLSLSEGDGTRTRNHRIDSFVVNRDSVWT